MAEFGICEFCEAIATCRIGGHPACPDHLEEARIAAVLEQDVA